MKSRLRRITVGGRSFAWTVRNSGGGFGLGYQLIVWGAGKNSAPLHARLRDYAKPGEVEQIIRYGLEHGWDPEARGPLVDTGAWEYVAMGAEEPSLVRTAG